MNRVLLTLFFSLFTGICHYQLYCSGTPGQVQPHTLQLRFKREESSSSESSPVKKNNKDRNAVAGVIISNSKNDTNRDTVLSVEAIGSGSGVISAALGENGTISGAVVSATDDESGSSSAAVSGTGVVSATIGNGTSFAFTKKNINSASSETSGELDEAIGISSSGDAVAEVISTNGNKTKINRVYMKKNKGASASASGSLTAASIVSDDSSAVATSSSGEGRSTGSSDSSEIGSSIAMISSSNKKKKSGIGASGSTSGGTAITSISASDEDDNGDTEHSGSILAISSRMRQNENSNRKHRRGPIYGNPPHDPENIRSYQSYRQYRRNFDS